MGLVLLTLGSSLNASGSGDDSDNAAEGIIRLSIPEPLVFDLVRPLGAPKGEVEVNSLFLKDRGGPLAWAPEAEVVIGRGLAVEFELPAEGWEVTTYRFAAQGLLPQFRQERPFYVHGWQAITEIPRQNAESMIAALYISGFRVSRRVSSLSLNGFSIENVGAQAERSALLNNTIFFEPGGPITTELESNLKANRKEVSARLMPQLHLALPFRMHFQVGAGAYRSASRSWEIQLAWRLIRELN